jgi:SAM-dependent methyltransferase
MLAHASAEHAAAAPSATLIDTTANLSPTAETQSTLSRYAAVQWSLAPVTENRVWRDDEYWITTRAKSRQFSFRMLRYWYMERLLAEARRAHGAPLRVLEIGVDRGQMKAFVDGAQHTNAEPLYSTWDAADLCPQHAALTHAGYGACMTLNLDDGDALAEFVAARHGQYDAIILLHVLEHLTQPERAVTFLSGVLRANGKIIGGFPVLPSGVARWREWQLRKSAQPFGHVSAFSPRRVRNMATRAGLVTDYHAGAFAVRASGSRLEEYAWWVRANVAFGAWLPGWPGEIYFQWRKPLALGARATPPALSQTTAIAAGHA